MDEFAKRIEELSPEKRELLEIFLHQKDTASAWRKEDYVAPRTPVEQSLAAIWEHVLGVERVGVNDDFFELGGDSIQSLQVVARARQAGLHLTTNSLFAHPTVAALAPLAEGHSVVKTEQGIIVGPVPLTPIQQWFFEQEMQDPPHWNQAVLLEVPSGAASNLFPEVFRQLVQHHDALRLRFENTAAGWRQHNAGAEAAEIFSFHDLSGLPHDRQSTALESVASELQSSLDLSGGPLIRAAHFDLGAERSGRLLVLTHHLVADGVSFRILVEDAQAAYEQLSQGLPIEFPPKTTSFRDWSNFLVDHSRTQEALADLSYWMDGPITGLRPFPVDHSNDANTEASARTITVFLTEDETRKLLHELPLAYRAQANEVLLTALAEALSEWTGTRLLLLDVEAHGREEIAQRIDLSRTIGWFTSIFPLHLDLTRAGTLADTLLTVKEQLRQVPGRGLSYGLLRYLRADPDVVEKLESRPRAGVVFNYLGQFDQVLSESQLFRLAHESYGDLYGANNMRPHLLQVFGSVMGGRLEMNLTYSENVHRRQTIDSVAQRFVEVLRDLISQSSSARLSPSDFPEAELTQVELDTLLHG